MVLSNLMGLSAYNNIKKNSLTKATTSQKLSSGRRINNAADDAAGMAISEKMRAQVRGLDQAERNIEDAKSYFVTGDGALSQISEMVIRIRELAVQSANDTNTDQDREKLDEECQELLRAIDSVVDSTEFNRDKILKSNGPVMEITTETTTISHKNMILSNTPAENWWGILSPCTTSSATTTYFYVTNIGPPSTSAGSIPMNVGTLLAQTFPGPGTFDNFVKNTMYGNGTISDPSPANREIFRKTFEDALSKGFQDSGVSPFDQLQVKVLFDSNGKMAIGFTDDENYRFGDAYCSGDLSTAYGHNFLHMAFNFTNPAFVDITDTITTSKETLAYPKKNLWVQMGANASQGNKFTWDTVSTKQIGLSEAKLNPFEEALKALENCDDAISYVNTVRGEFGAYINRLDAAIGQVTISSLNLSSAESRIRDADMAREYMHYVKSSVLEQSAQIMLAQANSASGSVLSLIKP